MTDMSGYQSSWQKGYDKGYLAGSKSQNIGNKTNLFDIGVVVGIIIGGIIIPVVCYLIHNDHCKCEKCSKTSCVGNY